VELLCFFRATYSEVFGFEHPPLHDPCTIALVLAPHLFNIRLMRVDVETSNPLSAGQTICDSFGLGPQADKPKNVHVAQSVDVEGFWSLMLEALTAANTLSRLNQKPQ